MSPAASVTLPPLFTSHASCGVGPYGLRLLPPFPRSMPPAAPALAACGCFRFLRVMLPAAPPLAACGCFRILCLLRRPLLPAAASAFYVPCFLRRRPLRPAAASAFYASSVALAACSPGFPEKSACPISRNFNTKMELILSAP